MRARDKQLELKTRKNFVNDETWLILWKLFKTLSAYTFGSQLIYKTTSTIQYHNHMGNYNLESCLWIMLPRPPPKSRLEINSKSFNNSCATLLYKSRKIA